MAMLKLCGCNKPIPITDKQCPTCSSSGAPSDTPPRGDYYRHYDANRRDDRATTFYRSAAWKRLRAAALVRDNYLCVRCLANNRFTQAAEVHHKISLKENFEKRFELSNLESLCTRCHRKGHKNLKKKA